MPNFDVKALGKTTFAQNSIKKRLERPELWKSWPRGLPKDGQWRCQGLWGLLMGVQSD